MPTNTAGSQARVYHQAQTHHISLAYTFTSLPGSSGVQIGIIPAGAYIIRASAAVTTSFNAGTAGTNNTFTIGTTTGTSNIVASSAIPGTAGVAALVMGTSTALLATVDMPIFLNNTSAGTAATTGAGLVAVEYICPDSILV